MAAALQVQLLERASEVEEMRKGENLDILKGESGLDHHSGPYVKKNHVKDHSSTQSMVLNNSKTKQLFIYDFFWNFFYGPNW